MKIFSRIAAAITAAFVSLFIAAPAFASGGHGEVEKFNPADEFSAVGQPVDAVASIITVVVLLIIVLVLASLISRPFGKSSK